MPRAGPRYWISLIAHFVTGQAVIQAVNLVTGFVILRLLSIEEYAIYVLAAIVQAIGAIGSDFGVSQGVTSIGASLRDEKPAFESLIRGAMRVRRRLFWLALPAMFLVSYFILRDNVLRLDVGAAIVALTVVNVWVQQSATMATSVLNTRHDSSGLFRAGLASALVRLVLAVSLCAIYPYALAALTVNLAGTLVLSWMLWTQYGGYDRQSRPDDAKYSKDLLRFALPLLPVNIYSLCVGQISAFLLGLAGATNAVAEFGALGRLGQIVGLLSLVNGFFIMPYLARISDRRTYTRRAVQAFAALSVVCATLIASAVMAPKIWLAILGSSYANLETELVLAMVGASLVVAGNLLYAMVLATRATQNQWVAILVMVAGQFAYVAYVDINETRQALILSLIPAGLAVIFQCAILVRIVFFRKAWTS